MLYILKPSKAVVFTMFLYLLRTVRYRNDTETTGNNDRPTQWDCVRPWRIYGDQTPKNLSGRVSGYFIKPWKIHDKCGFYWEHHLWMGHFPQLEWITGGHRLCYHHKPSISPRFDYFLMAHHATECTARLHRVRSTARNKRPVSQTHAGAFRANGLDLGRWMFHTENNIN